MIKYSSAPTGISALVENIKTKEKFAVSTLRNPYGVYETVVCRAPNLWIAGLKGFFSRFVFVVNSPTLQQAEQTHIRTAELFEQLNPKDLLRKYKTEGRIGMQIFVSSQGKEENLSSNERSAELIEKEITNLQRNKYRFWSNIQGISLFAFLVFFVACFAWNWRFLIPVVLFLILNLVAYINRMKSLGRDPATKDIDKVV